MTATAPGTWASSNWTSVRTSTTSAPVRLAAQQLDRGHRLLGGVHRDERAAVDADDVAEVRRLRPDRGERRLDEALLVQLGEQGVVGPLVADRGAHLHAHRRAAAHGAAEVAGPHLHLGRHAQQAAVEAAEDVAGALLRRRPPGRGGRRRPRRGSRRSGRPRARAAGGVDQREGGVLRPVAGGVEGDHADGAEVERPAVARSGRGRTRRRRRGGRGSRRPWRRPGGRGRRRGRRGCASRGRARSGRPCSGPARGTPRPPGAGRRPPRRRPSRRRSGTTRSPGRR